MIRFGNDMGTYAEKVSMAIPDPSYAASSDVEDGAGAAAPPTPTPPMPDDVVIVVLFACAIMPRSGQKIIMTTTMMLLFGANFLLGKNSRCLSRPFPSASPQNSLSKIPRPTMGQSSQIKKHTTSSAQHNISYLSSAMIILCSHIETTDFSNQVDA